jgi:hypothetical protein
MTVNYANPLAVATGGIVNDVVSGSTPAPTAPVLTGNVLSSVAIELGWSFIPYAEYYYLQRKIFGGSYSTIASNLEALYYRDNSCSPSTTYVYRVIAYNLEGTAASNELTRTTQAAVIPGGNIRWNFNPVEVVDAIAIILKADTTLQGANYLNGTNNIWKIIAPDDAANRLLVIQTPTLVPDAIQGYSGEVRVYCYVPMLNNGQINSVCNTIINRCEILLNNVSLAITSGKSQPMQSRGVVPAYFDPELTTPKNKSISILRLLVEVFKN